LNCLPYHVCPFKTVVLWLRFPGCPALAGESWLSCQGSVAALASVSCRGCPVKAFLSRLSCHLSVPKVLTALSPLSSLLRRQSRGLDDMRFRKVSKKKKLYSHYLTSSARKTSPPPGLGHTSPGSSFSSRPSRSQDSSCSS
jgi:hypothetical protein